MENPKLRKWIRKIEQQVEEKRDEAANLYAEFIKDNLHNDLMGWYEKNLQYKPGSIEAGFKEIIDKYNQLIEWLKTVEHTLKTK
jgi:hypothetical protein